MSKLFEIFIIPESSHRNLLGIWELNGNHFRDTSSNTHEFLVDSTDNLPEEIIKSKRYLCCDKKILRKEFSLELREMDQIHRGKYYPRIYKPIFSGLPNEYYVLGNAGYSNKSELDELISNHPSKNELYYRQPIDRNHLISSIEQLSTLIEMAGKIFRTVYPSEANKTAYGFDIRNLIILVCTEFEAQIKGILKANNINPIEGFYKTKDYVKLKDILKLKMYSVSLRLFPDYQRIYPFQNWDESYPTSSIPWYNSYNKIKHDREFSFNEGTLEVMINALSACYIMLLAQYGRLPEIEKVASGFWNITQRPIWHTKENYFVPFKSENWQEENFSV